MRKFEKYTRYRHHTNATLDIRILKVYHVNEHRTKLKVEYVHRVGDRIQYTGKGQDWHTDKVSIKSEDYKYWRVV